MGELFDVYEIEIAAPHKERLMVSGMTRETAEAYVRMAVMRRGVERSIFSARPVAGVEKDAGHG